MNQRPFNLKMLGLALITIYLVSLTFACEHFPTKSTGRNQNKIYFSKIEKAPQNAPKRQIDKRLIAKPSKLIVKADKAVGILKSFPGGNKAIKALSSSQQALLSSSSALSTLEPAGWWTPNESSGGIPGAQISVLNHEYWNVDITHGHEIETLAALNMVNFAGYPNADLNPDAVFPAGGPNGLMQFTFGSSPGTFLGVFKLSGIGANVDIYLGDTLIATYFVDDFNENYSFLVDVPDNYKTITAVYSGTSVDVGSHGLVFWSLTLYII